MCPPLGIHPSSVINKYGMINPPTLMRKGSLVMEKTSEMISNPDPRSSNPKEFFSPRQYAPVL
jgi:hypothetical protein